MVVADTADLAGTHLAGGDHQLPYPTGGNNSRLSGIDKRMLQIMILSGGRISSIDLSRKLGVPITTLQRRRKRLESDFMEIGYSLKIDKIGWRTANLLLSSSSRMLNSIGKTLIAQSYVTKVSRIMGDHRFDLQAEIVYKTNRELLEILDSIKSLNGVTEVAWLEPIEVMEKKPSLPEHLLNDF